VKSNDLVPQLENKASGNSYRQGVIMSWDQDTAENSVQVGGSIFANLPILNTSEASLLAPGDVVTIITLGASYAILGRLVIPGTPQAVSSIQSITNRIKATEDSSSGSRNSNSWGDLTGVGVGPAVTIRIGGSGRALVFWGAEMGQSTNASGSAIKWMEKCTPHIGIQVSGATTIAPEAWNAFNYNLEFETSATKAQSWIQGSTMHIFTGLNPGNTTFTMKYRHDGVLPATDVTLNFSSREIAVFAL
jgi:hypothetical protein